MLNRDYDALKAILETGTTIEAHRYVVGHYLPLYVLCYNMERHVAASDAFYALAKLIVETDPSECDYQTQRLGCVDATTAQLYDSTLPHLLVTTDFPRYFRLFELVVLHCNQTTLSMVDMLGRPLIHQIIVERHDARLDYAVCIPWIEALLRRGASVNQGNAGRLTMTPISLVDGWHKDAQLFMDYLLGKGAKSSTFTSELVVQKRSNCRDALRALGIVLWKKRAVVNKDVIRYLILPRVWETRLSAKWSVAVGGGSGVKKVKL